MKLTLNSLRRMVLEETKKMNRTPRRSRNKAWKRDRRLVENALRLLGEAEETQNLEDLAAEDQEPSDPNFKDPDAAKQAEQQGSSNLGFQNVDQIPPDVAQQAVNQLDNGSEAYQGGLWSHVSKDAGALKSTVDWLNAHLDADSNPAGSDVAQAIHCILGSGTQDGQNDQKIGSGPSKQTPVGPLIPTQGEISLFKSIGHPLCNPKSFIDCWSGDPHGGTKYICKAGTFILDGHHRWSTVACIVGPTGKINAVDFDIPHIKKEASEQVLAVSQVAIVGKAEFGQLEQGPDMVPFANASKPVKIGGKNVSMNILGSANKIDGLKALVKKGAGAGFDLTPYDGYASKYKNSAILSDIYLDYAVFGNQGPLDAVQGFTDKFKSAMGVTPPANKAKIADCTPQEKEAIVGQIVAKIKENWGSCNIDGSGKPPRSLMPQFDGGESHGSYGTGEMDDKGKEIKADIINDKETMKHMAQGEVNYKPQWLPPEKLAAGHYRSGDPLSESVDLRRWHKLAGILKD